jgi:putative ABC transport system permease protein
MKFAVIALRNLARNRRRTLLSLLIVAAGTIGTLLTTGFIRFSFEGLREAIIHGGIGHLEVVPRSDIAEGGSSAERPGLPGMTGWQALQSEIETVPHVLAAGAVVQFTGMISKGERSAAVLAVAGEPGRERRMRFEVKLRGGAGLPDAPPADGEDEVLLGTVLARNLGAQTGDVLTLLSLTTDGTLNALDLRVTGLITTGLQEVDTRIVRMHLASAQRLLGTQDITSLVIGLDDTSRTSEVQTALERRLLGREPSLAVADWKTRAPFYGQVESLYLGIFWFLGSVIFVLVCLSTSNTLMMSVMERVREIGTLLAIGTSRAQIAAIVLLEALWLGFLGALAGDLLGIALVAGINALGIQMPPPPGATGGIELHLATAPGDYAATVALMLVILGLAAAVPVAISARLRIADALRHV